VSNRQSLAGGRSARFFLETESSGGILGICNLTNIVRGAFQACHLGYSLDKDQQGKGLMSEALTLAIQYAFSELRLHRIEANYLPTNVRSANLLRRHGFDVNGYARDYLYIDGGWKDHVLTSLSNPDMPGLQ
jgi:ribosomal-protein-alanine N-acetyltransferase